MALTKRLFFISHACFFSETPLFFETPLFLPNASFFTKRCFFTQISSFSHLTCIDFIILLLSRSSISQLQHDITAGNQSASLLILSLPRCHLLLWLMCCMSTYFPYHFTTRHFSLITLVQSCFPHVLNPLHSYQLRSNMTHDQMFP